MIAALADDQEAPWGALDALVQRRERRAELGQPGLITEPLVQGLECLKCRQAVPALGQRGGRSDAGAGGRHRQRVAVIGDRGLAAGAHLGDEITQSVQLVEACA